MDTIEKKISPLIEKQFPEFYRTDGPIFVAFVKEYYKWLESEQRIACPIYLSSHKGTCKVTSHSANVIGNNSNFSEFFSNGEQIALYKDEDNNDYEIFTIDTIANNTFLTLTSDKIPSFSTEDTRYCRVRDNHNPLYHARRIYDYRDIDNTVDNFIIHFKETYLKNVQFDTNTNIRQLVKHALDIYRSKGTERAIDLLFKIVFGVPARIYYPGDDIWKLSDGHWYHPQYLEISLHKDSANFVNKQITGMTSGATAFVESAIRRTVKDRLIDVLYISAVNGEFITGEKINAPGSEIRTPEAPTIIGSLTALEVSEFGSGFGYSVGDIVDLRSPNGEQGQARVTEISDITGLVNFGLQHGGYGYTENSEIIISDYVLTVANVQVSANNESNEYFNLFDQLIQPLANIEYVNANGTYKSSMNVYTYDANNTMIGQGRVLSVSQNGTNGTVLVSTLSGNLDSDVLYSDSNTIVANISGFTDQTAVANVVGYSGNVVIQVINRSGSFENGEEIFQLDENDQEIANGTLISFTTTIGANGSIRTTNTSGIFHLNKSVRGRSSNATANVQHTQLQLGVFDTNGSFITREGNYVYAIGSDSNATVVSISDGTGATVGVSNSLLYTEIVEINTDYLNDYLSVELDANAYGFPALPTGNSNNATIDELLTYTPYTFGKLSSLVGINMGSGYTASPIVRVYEPVSYAFRRNDLTLQLENVNGNFSVGEIITQETSNARGLVVMANSSFMEVENLRVDADNDFVVTVDANTKIVGDSSATTADVLEVSEKNDTRYMGLNAIIDSEVTVSDGAVTALDVYDSGFGYVDGEQVDFYKAGNEYGTAFAVLGRRGLGKGYYKRKGGFLSDSKKIFDGEYYQEYSYEVRSSITLNKYADMLRELLHVAGTKSFAAYVLSSKANTSVNILKTKITSIEE